MTNLNDQFATPEAYVDSINAIHEDNMFTLAYSESMGSTAQDVADYLDMCTFSDVYKDRNGFRPRGYTLAEAREWLARDDGSEDYLYFVAPAPAEGEGWSYNGSAEGLERI